MALTEPRFHPAARRKLAAGMGLRTVREALRLRARDARGNGGGAADQAAEPGPDGAGRAAEGGGRRAEPARQDHALGDDADALAAG